MKTTKYGQTFYEEEALALVAAGKIQPCPALTGEEDHHLHDSASCDYCTVYYGGLQALCTHDDQEGWCEACGKATGDYGCVSCGGGVALSARCLDCGATQYMAPGGPWEL